jgi:uncharacterized membrane protein YjgN (DUF898 family)
MIVFPPPPPPAPEAAPPTQEQAAVTRHYSFSFTGNAKEYFRIWVVNLFLSIITLGIYSPWAKVRKKRYIYGNTWVADANFDYHGNPIAILKGRIVAVLALVAYNVGGHFVPRLGTLILLVLMVAAPWLVVRTFQFNAVNSSYRNLRFHFHGHYREGLGAIAPLLLSPLVAFLLPEVAPGQVPKDWKDFSALLLPSLPIVIFYPYVVGAIKRFQVRRSTFGSAPFASSLRIRSFYLIYLLNILVVLGVSIVAGIVMAAGMFVPGVGWAMVALGYMFIFAVSLGYTRSRVANVTFNATTLAGAHFVSRISAIKLGWIYFVNLLAMAVSFGLLVPWAVTRTARYRASCLLLECPGDLDTFAAQAALAVGATGEELGDFLDLDLSL